MKKFLLLCMAIFSCNIVGAQVLRLSSYESDIYTCANPNNGFIRTSFSIKHNSSIDSFVINLNNNTFTWKDYKGQSTNKIYKVQKDGNSITFATQYNSIRVTGSIIDIIYFDGGQWYMVTYKCKSN